MPAQPPPLPTQEPAPHTVYVHARPLVWPGTERSPSTARSLGRWLSVKNASGLPRWQMAIAVGVGGPLMIAMFLLVVGIAVTAGHNRSEAVASVAPGGSGGANAPDPTLCGVFSGPALMAGRWTQYGPEEWGCQSPYYRIPGSAHSTMAYYVDGTERSARRCRLVVNVWAGDNEQQSRADLAIAAGELLRRAMLTDLTRDQRMHIERGRPGSWSAGRNAFRLIRSEWSSQKGYDLTFSIDVYGR